MRAPELIGRGGWLNTGGRDLRLADFRGRFCLVDFWTFCCVNCLHVIEELRPLEAKYRDVLTVVGVHSPKFRHEADPEAVRDAVERLDIRHPVLDDPTLITWQAYTARAWPTLVLIDPAGYIVAQYAGEGHGHAIDALLTELIPRYEAALVRTDLGSDWAAPSEPQLTLRFPSRAIRRDDGTFLVTNAGSVVELEPDLATIKARFEGFREPNGLCVLPYEAAIDADVVVADTVDHTLRGLRPNTGEVRTLAGTGRSWLPGDSDDVLSSPWDVAWFQDRVWIAMAGIHQLWTYDPRTGKAEPVAGTRNEGLVDGPAATAWLAQPSGLATSNDGSRLWFVDAETSALRYIEGDEVHTVVGTGLFDFGLRDGPAEQALFQHPLGLCVLPDDSVAVADTYNGAIRRYDPTTNTVTTIATGLAEPSDVIVDEGRLDEGRLIVVESAGHRLVRLPLDARVANVEGFAHQTQRPTIDLPPGDVELVVVFEPPPGQKLDDSDGSPTRLLVSSTPPALLREGSGRGTELTRRLVLDPSVGSGVLHVAAMAATCDVDADYPVCHMHQQDWGVPVRLTDGAAGAEGADARLTLVLADS